MAHVDRELLKIYNTIKEIKPEKKLGITPAHILQCKFNLNSESMLSTLVRVEWRQCVKHVLENMHLKSLMKPELNNRLIPIYQQGSASIMAALKKKGILIIAHEGASFKNLPKWLFMYSVIGNIIKNKGYLPSGELNVNWYNMSIDDDTKEKWKDMKIKQVEIPQFTMSEESKDKEISELNVDDFEIWNYIYD